MKYTVIQCSGWQSDYWRVVETFDSLREARAFKNTKQQRTEPRDDFYNVRIMAHKKHLVDLTEDFVNVKFSDGTLALGNW